MFKPPRNYEDEEEQAPQPPHPKPQPRPVSAHPPTPSAPPVPRELLSARPAMTRVVPRSPDKVRDASQAMAGSQAVGPQAPPSPEEIADRQERIDYLKGLRNESGAGKSGRGKKWIIILIIFLLLVVAGIGALLYKMNQPEPKSDNSATTATDAPLTQQTETPPATEQVTQKEYDSTNFGVGLKYPSDWKLDDTANALTIVSPVTKLSGADGQDKSGAIVVTIRHKQTSLPEYKAGNAVAVLDSKNVTYSAPAEGQRGTTYLTFSQYAATTTKGAMDAIYITGNSGYKKTQAIPQADVIKVDPLVTVTFVACDSGCSPTSQATQLNADTFVTTQNYTVTETILKSLAFN